MNAFRWVPIAFALAGCAALDDLYTRDFQAFLGADADHSGKLDQAEARGFLPQGARFERYDVDGDGLIAWTEYQQIESLRRQPAPRHEADQR
jgi:hypothetical protein